MSRLLVTGGTGTLGRLVVPLLLDTGRKVRVLSRRGHESRNGIEFVIGDVSTGTGVDAAVENVETIVHCAGSAKGDDVKTRNLVQAALRAGAQHLVYISVVGAERVPVASRIDRAAFGYFGAKLAAEEFIADSGLPWTTLRATQFHDSMLATVRQMTKMPVVPIPAGTRFQPIDASEVAERLVELSLGAPAGLVPDLAGPGVHGMDELVLSYLKARHRRRLIIPVKFPGGAARAIRAGANLAPKRAVGRLTWYDFLAERLHG